MNPAEGIRDFIENVARGVSNFPHRTKVSMVDEAGEIVYTIAAFDRDVYKIMGRDGIGISSVRNLAAAAAQQHGLRVKILLPGEEKPKPRGAIPQRVKPADRGPG